MPLEDIVKTLTLSTQQFQHETHKFQQETHKFQQETRARIQNLEVQVSQLASSVSRLESQGKLPSQTIINPKQHVSAITLCSGKELQFKNGTRRGYAQQGKTEDESSVVRRHAKQGKHGRNSKILQNKLKNQIKLARSIPRCLCPNLPSRRDLSSPKKRNRT
ncbi:UNVERIFIED_CONTAM: hypothetical protein Sradi_0696200 [Sesamum radiatum]|uniref:Uncharacterized protein n=1 Tax=Sesamum radiatum TaxID=300843 RepID=A0AAW2VN90_SESRA